MQPEDVNEQAKRGEILPLYLVLGEEQFLASGVIKCLRDTIAEQGVVGLNDDVFDAASTSASQVIEAARTTPMMAARRFLLVRGIERWEAKSTKGATSELDKLADYAQDAVGSSVLVLSAGKLDKRRRLYTLAKKRDFLVNCEPPPQGVLPSWVKARAISRGSRFAPGAAELVVELAGPELSQLADAVERLCLYVGDETQIDEEAVAESLVRIRTNTVWQLVDAVARRDAAAALETLEQVFDPQDRGLRLVGVLAWQARQLVRFESATRAGLSPSDAAKRAGAPPFKARDLARQVKGTPRRELERWLPTLSQIDLALKGGSKRPARAVLEHAILDLCHR
jgi:DNA polymerase-3 subunit delta